MRILIGSTNPSKVELFTSLLAGTGATMVTLGDLGVDDEPHETGRTPEENARIKARFYGRYAQAVICADSGLYLDSLPMDDPRQPGLHVRSPLGVAPGVRLDDEQMIAYYAALAHDLGGKAMAYYLDGLAVKRGDRIYGWQQTREEARAGAFYLTDAPCAARRPGWPLDSLSLDQAGVPFLDARREGAVQRNRADMVRLRAFLLEALGLEEGGKVP